MERLIESVLIKMKMMYTPLVSYNKYLATHELLIKKNNYQV